MLVKSLIKTYLFFINSWLIFLHKTESFHMKTEQIFNVCLLRALKLQQLSPGCLRVQNQSFDDVRHEQTALLLSGQTVKNDKNTETAAGSSGPRDKGDWEKLKDTTPRCEGWRNQHQTRTGADQRSEQRDLWTRPCTPSSKKQTHSSVT